MGVVGGTPVPRPHSHGPWGVGNARGSSPQHCSEAGWPPNNQAPDRESIEVRTVAFFEG